MNDSNLFFQLLRLSIGRRSSLSRTLSSAEWTSLYGLSVKQALAGVCFCGIQRLPKEQVVHLPKQLMMQWFAIAEQIKQQNRRLNDRAKELSEKFAEGGFRSCVLKGQGVAFLYNINLDLNVNRNHKANATFRSLGMEKFVSAVMWLLQEVFGLERELMLFEPSEKYGRRLLDIVMVGGNFGQYDKRNRHGKENDIQRGFRNLRHNMQVVKFYPSEVLWAPFWKMGHFVWRKAKGFE